MKKDKCVYSTAYTLGVEYLDILGYNPRYCVMFDIDDTLINTKGDCIKPMILLLNECRKRKLKVLIITARDSRYANETINELKQNKIKYDYLYLRNSPTDDNDFFKSKVKERLYTEGYLTIMSVGDNLIDIIGPYSGYGIKLPNKQDPRLFHLNYLGQLENVSIKNK